jgi:hypothetical protein
VVWKIAENTFRKVRTVYCSCQTKCGPPAPRAGDTAPRAGDTGKWWTILERGWQGIGRSVYEILSKIKASFPRLSKMQDLSCAYARDAKYIVLNYARL